jgi:hypothetical protein
MSCGDITGSETMITSILNSVKTNTTLQNNQNTIDTMVEQIKLLQQQKIDTETAVTTYDREFQERMERPPPKRMFNTTQDWVLAIFFVTYTLMVMTLLFTSTFNILTFSLFILGFGLLSYVIVVAIQKYA